MSTREVVGTAAVPVSRPGAPLRVAHVIDSLRPGGAEQLVLTTVKHLDRARFEPLVVALSPPLDLKAELEALGVPVCHLGVRGPLDWRRGLVGLARVLRQYRPHIVHTHLLHANFFGRLASLAAGRPAVVTTLHHLDYTHWASDSMLFKGRKLFERLAAPRVNAGYIAVSRAVRDDYVRHFGLKDVTVNYNYLDTREFVTPGPDAIAAARRRLGFTDRELILLNVARLNWEKGQTHLLVAMAEIRRLIPEARLLIAGEGPERDALQRQARSLGVDDAVIFLGNRRDIGSLLALTDVFVFPSLAEGLGIALLEAMAAGRPVVATGVEGIAEIIEDGKNGILVPGAEPTAIVKAVLALHADPDLRRRLGDAARRTAEERFSITAGLAKLTAFYDTVTERAR